MAPTPEEFQAWQDHPISRWVFEAIRLNIDEHRQEWERRSWLDGECDQIALVELRSRADGLKALTESSYEGLCETHGQDPRTD